MKMQDLQRLASDERMIPDAPVRASRTVTIDAPVEKVWTIQTDVSNWASWYPYLRNAKLSGPFGPGTKLSYGGFPKHDLAIAKARSPDLAMIYGRLMGFSAVTKWEMKPLSGTRTEVTFTESSVGFLISTLYSSEKLEEHLDRWLGRLKLRAEKR